MRAAVLTGYGRPLELKELPDPAPGPGQVAVDIRACGVCGSDLFLQKGGFGSELPVVPGHEAAGVVSAVGPGVDSVKAGTPAALYYIDHCGECRLCRAGRVNMCLGVRRMGVEFDGGFAEKAVLPARCVIPVREDDDPAAVAVLTDAVATPYHALVRIARVRAGETVAVFGVGGTGSNAVQLAAYLGCRVIAVSRSDANLELAARLGADAVVRGGGGAAAGIAEAAGPGGPDAIIQTVGSSDVYRQAFEAAGIGCRIAAVGAALDPFPVAPMGLIWREASLAGSRGFTPRDIREVLDLHRKGAITTEHLLQSARPLEQVNEALDDLREGAVTRSVITFGDGWQPTEQGFRGRAERVV